MEGGLRKKCKIKRVGALSGGWIAKKSAKLRGLGIKGEGRLQKKCKIKRLGIAGGKKVQN